MKNNKKNRLHNSQYLKNYFLQFLQKSNYNDIEENYTYKFADDDADKKVKSQKKNGKKSKKNIKVD